MGLTRRQILVTTASTAMLAGCTGDGETTDPPDDGAAGRTAETATSSPTPASTESATETAGSGTPESTTGPGDATVRVDTHPEFGEILVDADGMALYMFDSDTRGAGESTCYDGCAEAWPPLVVDDGDPTAEEGVTAELTTFERENGDSQVAADGWPLYYFASDESPGDVNGHGVNDVWWVVRPDGTPVRPDATATDGGTETADEAGTETETSDDGYEYPAVGRQ